MHAGWACLMSESSKAAAIVLVYSKYDNDGSDNGKNTKNSNGNKSSTSKSFEPSKGGPNCQHDETCTTRKSH